MCDSPEVLRTALARAAILLQRDGDDAGAKAIADHLLELRKGEAQLSHLPDCTYRGGQD